MAKKKLRTRRNPAGYLEFWDGRLQEWVATHRRAMENRLGRELRPGEVVHHLDEDKTNNRHSNLVALSAAVHTVIHHHDARACLRCGRSGHWAAACYERADKWGKAIA